VVVLVGGNPTVRRTELMELAFIVDCGDFGSIFTTAGIGLVTLCVGVGGRGL
jgi:hypothetical protein